MNKFLRILLDHVASDAKTPLQLVEAAFHEWRTTSEERDAHDAYMYDQYVNTIDMPRIERARIYEEYCAEKARLRDTWRLAPAGDKARAFRAWMNLQLPTDLADAGIDLDRIYTKNVTSI